MDIKCKLRKGHCELYRNIHISILHVKPVESHHQKINRFWPLQTKTCSIKFKSNGLRTYLMQSNIYITQLSAADKPITCAENVYN